MKVHAAPPEGPSDREVHRRELLGAAHAPSNQESKSWQSSPNIHLLTVVLMFVTQMLSGPSNHFFHHSHSFFCPLYFLNIGTNNSPANFFHFTCYHPLNKHVKKHVNLQRIWPTVGRIRSFSKINPRGHLRPAVCTADKTTNMNIMILAGSQFYHFNFRCLCKRTEQ